jgi:quinol monooxygenase YgiN
MTVGLVALHYPRPKHWDEMISRVHQAAEVMAATPGCLAVDCWVSDDHQAVVTTGQWESEQTAEVLGEPLVEEVVLVRELADLHDSAV